MVGGLGRFLKDEAGGVVDTVVTLGLLIIIVGGVWYALHGGMQDIGNAVEEWICERLPKMCG